MRAGVVAAVSSAPAQRSARQLLEAKAEAQRAEGQEAMFFLTPNLTFLYSSKLFS